MSWRIRTVHSSHYNYASPVIASYNEVRITPTSARGQVVIEEAVRVEPSASLLRYVDYFSSAVVSFDITTSHEQLVVVGSCVVDTRDEVEIDDRCSWVDLIDPILVDEQGEYLVETSITSGAEEISSAAPRFDGAPHPAAAVENVIAWLRESMAYEPGTTAVSTSALEAWNVRRGVCQDFSHIAIALCRRLGIPTRYVSGYLHPGGEVGELVTGAGHAWIECFLGDWVAFDPTHGGVVTDRHVRIAAGRDYRDVAPFRGIYQGGRLERLDVTVDLVRLS